MNVKYLIIGGGPTGLAAAHRLRELGEESFILLERNDYFGGLAASFTDENGFTWDIGGHVVFSHYEYFDRLMDSLMGADRLVHQRICNIRMEDRWVPYPFQNNLRHLSKESAWECVRGLLPEYRTSREVINFRDWIDYVFGAGIAAKFMIPYNFKVWATPAEQMAYQWIGERVSVIDLKGVLESLILEKDNFAWGPNSKFFFPSKGGTGEIFRRLAARVEDRARTGCRVISVDSGGKTVRTSDGQEIRYENMLYTGPLDILVTRLMVQADPVMADAATDLHHNSVFVAGVGIDAPKDDPTCWMYFPESNAPFYRVTNFHNYAPDNVARPGHQAAFMCETSYSSHKPEKLNKILPDTIDGLVNVTLMDSSDREKTATAFEFSADYGYPVPTLGRDSALATIQPRLERVGIYSRGRFGGFKYEVSNMDHSVMQGVEWAERMVQGKEETTYTL